MFETVAPEKFVPRSRKVLYETLPVSILVHAALFAAVLVMATWQVAFPDAPPNLYAVFRLEDTPTPPPPPPPPAAAPKKVDVVRVEPRPQQEELAPTFVPELVPEVSQNTVEGVEGGIEGGVVGGVIGGSLEGVQGGVIGGVVGGTVGSVAVNTEPPAPPATIIVKRDDPLPTAPMSMTYPQYPEDARNRGWEDIVVVRYIIGKDGRVRDVIVLASPEHDVFEKITVKAMKRWRFRPYKKDGVPQEIIHELTIYFKLEAT